MLWRIKRTIVVFDYRNICTLLKPVLKFEKKKVKSSASTGPRLLLVVASVFPATQGIQWGGPMQPSSQQQKSLWVWCQNVCGFKSTMRTHTPRCRREHRRCFRHPTRPWKGKKQLWSLKEPHPAMNVHGSIYQAGVYGTAPKENSQDDVGRPHTSEIPWLTEWRSAWNFD